MSAETVEQMLRALAAADDVVASARGALKQAESEYEAIADRVFAYLDEQGTDQMRSKNAGLTVAIHETESYSFEDFNAFSAFMLRNKATELLQRRLSGPAVRALIEQRDGKMIPGLAPYKKRRLSVTKVKGT